MAQLLGLILLSLFITGVLLVPFIDFLYRMKFRRHKQKTVDMFDKPTPTFDKYNNWKAGTPFGGGILIIAVVSILTLWSYGLFEVTVNPWQLFVLMFTFLSFGLLGFYDDLRKLVSGKSVFFDLDLDTNLLFSGFLLS